MYGYNIYQGLSFLIALYGVDEVENCIDCKMKKMNLEWTDIIGEN